jgi:hypothetical protein
VRFRQNIGAFVDQFARHLETLGWLVLDEAVVQSNNITLDLQHAIWPRNSPVDVVAFYWVEQLWWQAWNKTLGSSAFTKVLIVEDLNWKAIIELTRNFASASDGVFARYPEACSAVLKMTCFPLHHAASRQFFQVEKPRSPKEQVLISGALLQRFYPLRSKGVQLMQKNKSNLFSLLKHPGYHQRFSNSSEVLRRYAENISAYRIAMSGGGQNTARPYVLAKNFEIPATGTVTDR